MYWGIKSMGPGRYHVVGKGVIKELRRRYPESNIVAIDFDPGASEVNQLNRLKLMLSTANKNLNK